MSDITLQLYDGASAVITGGASGIGRALAEELARRGCEVVLADLQINLAEKVASAIQETGGKANAFELDVADFSAFELVVNKTFERIGRLDFMFNNAGIGIGGPVELHSIKDWNRIIDVNLRGVVNGIQAAYPIMLRQGFGHIINTASMGGFMPTPGITSYGATKHAVVGLSKSLRIEAEEKGIRVSVLCPGVVRTPILDGGKYGKMLVDISPEQKRDGWKKLKPMPADAFARKVLNAIAKNKAIIIIPSKWKRIWWVNRLSPYLGQFLAKKQYRKLPRE